MFKPSLFSFISEKKLPFLIKLIKVKQLLCHNTHMPSYVLKQIHVTEWLHSCQSVWLKSESSLPISPLPPPQIPTKKPPLIRRQTSVCPSKCFWMKLFFTSSVANGEVKYLQTFNWKKIFTFQQKTFQLILSNQLCTSCIVAA